MLQFVSLLNGKAGRPGRTCASGGTSARRAIDLVRVLMRVRTLTPTPPPGSPAGFLAGQEVSLLLWFRSC